MSQNYLPKVNPNELCEALALCSVRKREEEYLVAVKRLDGTIEEIPLIAVANADEFEGKKIARNYSSGHVFIENDKVFLVTTSKKWKTQKQFTGGWPREDINKEVFFRDELWVVRIHLEKVEDNALIRTNKRTGVIVTDTYNTLPLVDWALMEKEDETGKIYWSLVCLMHFVVKTYEWQLWANVWTEDVIAADWYSIDDLLDIPFVAPNAYIITKKAQEIIS